MRSGRLGGLAMFCATALALSVAAPRTAAAQGICTHGGARAEARAGNSARDPHDCRACQDGDFDCRACGTGAFVEPLLPSAPGEEVCGRDARMWRCTEDGWLGLNVACGGATPSCTCYGGATADGTPIDPAATSCGYTVCGTDALNWRCGATGWEPVGTTCGGATPTCSCSGGFALDGTPIDPAATSCGYTVCGGDALNWRCGEAGWEALGTACTSTTPACSCSGGVALGGAPIDPAATYCGYTVCGTDHQSWQCTDTGWLASGTACELSSGGGGTPACSCSGGIALGGAPIDPAATYCGYTVCGTDHQTWQCTEHGWSGAGDVCGTRTCEGGYDVNWLPIDPAVTFEGFTVCGTDYQTWQCTSTGWLASGTACQ